MSLSIVTAPTVEFLTLDHAKDFLRVETADEDAVIAGMVSTVNEHLDGDEGILGRCLITQTWLLTCTHFTDEIELPLPPLLSVGSVKYYNSADVLTTVATTVYETDLNGKSGGFVRKLGNQTWPADVSTNKHNPIEITFNAGYGPSWNDVPKTLQHAALMLLAHYYENREAVHIGNEQVTTVPKGFDSLVDPHRTIGSGAG